MIIRKKKRLEQALFAKGFLIGFAHTGSGHFLVSGVLSMVLLLARQSDRLKDAGRT
jgi:hypothetical protein